MAELAEVWKQALPKMMEGVTGVGVWTALKTSVPIVLDDGMIILGVPAGQTELGGHLKIPSTIRVVETVMSSALAAPVRLRVIDGITEEDYVMVKRRDAERRRMQDAQLAKERAQLSSKSNWDTVYEQLSRRHAAVQNRSLPQNRARFFDEACAIVAEARRGMSEFDDMGERNFARCLERIAQYCEIPSTLVALEVLKRSEEI